MSSAAQEWFRAAVAAVLRAGGGPIPRHVAIVMDGNRRFAASRNMRRENGHKFGADKLLEVLEWCLALGVRCLSVYAFSTDNFKRSQTEVQVLFALAEEKLDQLAVSPVIAKHRVRVQVLGELRLLPPGLQRAAAGAMTATWHHDGPVLNVCFAYTGREDIAQAVGAMGAGVADGRLAKAAVTEETLARCLYGGAFDTMVTPESSAESAGKNIGLSLGSRVRAGVSLDSGHRDSAGQPISRGGSVGVDRDGGQGSRAPAEGGRRRAGEGEGGRGGWGRGEGKGGHGGWVGGGWGRGERRFEGGERRGGGISGPTPATALAEGSMPVDLLIRTSGATLNPKP